MGSLKKVQILVMRTQWFPPLAVRSLRSFLTPRHEHSWHTARASKNHKCGHQAPSWGLQTALQAGCQQEGGQALQAPANGQGKQVSPIPLSFVAGNGPKWPPGRRITDQLWCPARSTHCLTDVLSSDQRDSDTFQLIEWGGKKQHLSPSPALVLRLCTASFPWALPL